MISGTQLRLKGMRLAASKHKMELLYVQGVARFIGRHRVLVTIEDVREAIAQAGRSWTLGNAAGAVFKGNDWECAGFSQARHPEAHARMVRTWRLKT